MKILLLLIVTVISLCSACQKDLQYSCNKEADKWVKSNLASIRQMGRAGFLAVSPTHQRAAFRAFSPEQRRTVWRQKMEESLFLNWSVAEKDHIRTMLVIVDKYKNIFNENFPEKDAFLIEAYKWKKYAVTTFGWDNNVFRGIIGNPNKMKNTKGELFMTNNILSQTETNKQPRMQDCDCQQSEMGEGVILDDCAEPGCFNKICDKSLLGCGILWLDPCDGICWIPQQ